jgi:hypothetical protein
MMRWETASCHFRKRALESKAAACADGQDAALAAKQRQTAGSHHGSDLGAPRIARQDASHAALRLIAKFICKEVLCPAYKIR